LNDATVTLPLGVAVSPSSAGGLQACTPDEIQLGSDNQPTCPPASTIGSAIVMTPLLPNPLTGSVHLGCDGAPPTPCVPAPAGPHEVNLAKLYIVLNGPGLLIKLPGTVTVDTSTGQVTATFANNPPLPFSDFLLTFKGGPRAPLANPASCGTFTTVSDLAPYSAPWSGPDATPSSSFVVTGCGDPGRFAPSFLAGAINPVAGSFSPFVLSFSRSDSDQELSGLSMSLPRGVLARLAGVPLCSDAAANAGACPAGSQVGSVEVGAGPGPDPFFLPGRVYLTGPYEGAPFGLAVVVPAVAGPFDLGTVVVRQAIHIDPATARVTVVSDPFPRILDGIPLRLRRVDVTLDRPGFVVNPTSCDPMRVTGTLVSTQGSRASVSSRFQVGDCAGLGFSPRLRMSLTGRGRTRSGDHPTLTATLTDHGGANLRSARVALPLSLALDPNNSQHVCPYAVAQAVHGGPVGCPADTVVGEARAVTPLLDHPLAGRVYLVQGVRFNRQHQAIRTLPSLLVALRGQIALDLRAQSAVDGAGRLVTTFGSIPDAAVSKFTLTINGGPRGILVITGTGESICTAAQTALVRLGAQSGKIQRLRPKLAAPACGKGGRHGGRRRKHGARRGRAAMDARRVRRDR
jgi:hypothetical protein